VLFAYFFLAFFFFFFWSFSRLFHCAFVSLFLMLFCLIYRLNSIVNPDVNGAAEVDSEPDEEDQELHLMPQNRPQQAQQQQQQQQQPLNEKDLSLPELIENLLKQNENVSYTGPRLQWTDDLLSIAVEKLIKKHPKIIVMSDSSQWPLFWGDLMYWNNDNNEVGDSLGRLEESLDKLKVGQLSKFIVLQNSVVAENQHVGRGGNLGGSHWMLTVVTNGSILVFDSYNNDRKQNEDLLRLQHFLKVKRPEVPWEIVSPSYSKRIQAQDDDFSCGLWIVLTLKEILNLEGKLAFDSTPQQLCTQLEQSLNTYCSPREMRTATHSVLSSLKFMISTSEKEEVVVEATMQTLYPGNGNN
jgi:hypothetical protein